MFLGQTKNQEPLISESFQSIRIFQQSDWHLVVFFASCWTDALWNFPHFCVFLTEPKFFADSEDKNVKDHLAQPFLLTKLLLPEELPNPQILIKFPPQCTSSDCDHSAPSVAGKREWSHIKCKLEFLRRGRKSGKIRWLECVYWMQSIKL